MITPGIVIGADFRLFVGCLTIFWQKIGKVTIFGKMPEKVVVHENISGKMPEKVVAHEKINEFEYYFEFDIYLIRNSNYHY